MNVTNRCFTSHRKELDEVGKLLEQNSYNIKSDDMQTPENNLNENEVNE